MTDDARDALERYEGQIGALKGARGLPVPRFSLAPDAFKALRAVLDMADTSEREGLTILPAAVRREIADALAGEG